MFSNGLTDLTDQLMVLKSAVKKGGGKGSEFTFSCDACGSLKSLMIADPASVSLPECDGTQKCFNLVIRLADQPEVNGPGVFFKSLLAPEAFLERMDVMAVEKSRDIDFHLTEYRHRIYRTGAAAGM